VVAGAGLGAADAEQPADAAPNPVQFCGEPALCAKDHDELAAAALAKDTNGEIEIYTPTEMTELLDAAPESLVGFLVLGAFAGVRHAEIQRLDWRDVHWEHDLIEVRAAKAKTASRRTIPMKPNLKAWLAARRQAQGPVCGCRNVTSAKQKLVNAVNRRRRRERKRVWLAERRKFTGSEAEGAVLRAAHKADESWKFRWKHNALRHSFINYRVADIQNVAQVALEAGNSPQMIFKHYRELVRPATAKEWFSIMPKA
jgi:integrase